MGMIKSVSGFSIMFEIDYVTLHGTHFVFYSLDTLQIYAAAVAAGAAAPPSKPPIKGANSGISYHSTISYCISYWTAWGQLTPLMSAIKVEV